MTKILVIEDEPHLLDGILSILKIENFEVIGAANGRIGVDMALEHEPDLIVSDIMMPVMDGYSVLIALRSDSRTVTIPFIFLTAKAERIHVRRGMTLGANDYLTKPFTQDELLDTINARLEEQKIIAEQQETKLEGLRTAVIRILPHELRTPLVSVLGFGELIRDNANQLSTEQISDMAGLIVKGGERLHRLVENYLLYANIEALESNPDKADAYRQNVIDDTEMLISRAALEQVDIAEREGDLVLEINDCRVMISEDGLCKIVEELTSNSFKFSEPGTTVKVTTTVNNGMFELCVKDSGHGMTKEEEKQISAFMQFGRGVHEQQGPGLGLIIVKRLAELFGGKLKIESKPNEGTQMCVRLKLAE
jgi:two-component system, sensor histidine kinase and response regulator